MSIGNIGKNDLVRKGLGAAIIGGGLLLLFGKKKDDEPDVPDQEVFDEAETEDTSEDSSTED